MTDAQHTSPTQQPGGGAQDDACLQIKEIQQAFRFALDPTPRQEDMFRRHAGGARFAYNWGVAQIIAALDAVKAERDAGVEKPTTKTPRHFDLCVMWTAHKNDPANEMAWVGENFAGTYQAALRDAAGAWKAFFDSRAGKRKGRKVGRPRFKSKHRTRPSFQVHGSVLRVVDTQHLKLPKIGVVHTHENTRKLLKRVNAGDARLVRGTVSQDSTGRWYIALTVQMKREVRTLPSARQRAGGTVGLDLGVRDLVTLSDRRAITNPAHLEKELERLRAAQRALSRCRDGSAGRDRARRRVARIHGRVANLRKEHLSKVASQLVHAHAVIAVEGWDVQATLERGSKRLPKKARKNRNRTLAGAGLGQLRFYLSSRATWYGSQVLVTDRHLKTSRICSACGATKTKSVPPANEQFHCDECGLVEDRRVNSARVLKSWAAAQDT